MGAPFSNRPAQNSCAIAVPKLGDRPGLRVDDASIASGTVAWRLSWLGVKSAKCGQSKIHLRVIAWQYRSPGILRHSRLTREAQAIELKASWVVERSRCQR